jgi:hypothetical protein
MQKEKERHPHPRPPPANSSALTSPPLSAQSHAAHD